MKKAFTLLEMLIVVAIIGVLMGVLISSFSGASESARALKCLANMRNLARAAASCCPPTMSVVTGPALDKSTGTRRFVYSEGRGYISRDTRGKFPAYGKEPPNLPVISLYEEDRRLREHALTNSALWQLVDHNREIFVCPTHVSYCKSQNLRPLFSYLMNGDFAMPINNYTNPDRRLLFAEVPFMEGKNKVGDWFPKGKSGSGDTDSALQFKTCGDYAKAMGVSGSSGRENIGGNHRNGHDMLAHVVFCDGHVEKLRVSGISADNLIDLTKWLCTGKEAGRNKNKWELLTGVTD